MPPANTKRGKKNKGDKNHVVAATPSMKPDPGKDDSVIIDTTVAPGSNSNGSAENRDTVMSDETIGKDSNVKQSATAIYNGYTEVGGGAVTSKEDRHDPESITSMMTKFTIKNGEQQTKMENEKEEEIKKEKFLSAGFTLEEARQAQKEASIQTHVHVQAIQRLTSCNSYAARCQSAAQHNANLRRRARLRNILHRVKERYGRVGAGKYLAWVAAGRGRDGDLAEVEGGWRTIEEEEEGEEEPTTMTTTTTTAGEGGD